MKKQDVLRLLFIALTAAAAILSMIPLSSCTKKAENDLSPSLPPAVENQTPSLTQNTFFQKDTPPPWAIPHEDHFPKEPTADEKPEDNADEPAMM